VLLLRGAENGSPAQGVHDYFVANLTEWDQWDRTFLITDLAPLTPEEKQTWFEDNTSNYYAVLRNRDQNSLKQRVAHGRITDLFTNGVPDKFEILDALQAGR